MARALLLDAEGTLITLAEPPARVYARTAREHGLEVDEARVERELPGRRRPRAIPQLDRVARAEIPGLEREGWREQVRELMGDAAADGACFDALFSHYAQARAWRVSPGAERALTEAQGAGWRVGIVSNMDARLAALLAALGLVDLLDAALYPAACGLAKPDPRIYRAALDALDARADASLYVGDRERDCLDGARAAGLATLRYDPGAAASGSGVLAAWSDLAAQLERAVPSPSESR